MEEKVLTKGFLNVKTEIYPLLDAHGFPEGTLEDLLDFLNNRGLITYFKEPEKISNIVVMDPQWLVKAVTLLIRDFALHDAPNFDNKSTLETAWAKFVQLGTR